MTVGRPSSARYPWPLRLVAGPARPPPPPNPAPPPTRSPPIAWRHLPPSGTSGWRARPTLRSCRQRGLAFRLALVALICKNAMYPHRYLRTFLGKSTFPARNIPPFSKRRPSPTTDASSRRTQRQARRRRGSRLPAPPQPEATAASSCGTPPAPLRQHLRPGADAG